MFYELDNTKLEEQEVVVRQFEHNITTVYIEISISELNTNIKELTPCVLLSVGEEIKKDNGLSYMLTDDKATLNWEISQDCTQKAGTFLAQFAFIAEDGTVKLYTDRFVFKVLPSVDVQKAIFENRPRFVERLWNKIVQKISDSIPKKLSELENDSGYVNSENIPSRLSELENDSGYITSEALSEYSETSDVNAKLSLYATTSSVTQQITTHSKSLSPRQIISSTLPTYAATTSLGAATLAADSEKLYTAYYHVSRTSSSTMSLEKMSVIVTSPQNCTADATVVFEVNAAGVKATGSTVYEAKNLFVKGESTVGYLQIELHKNVCHVTFTKYLASDATPVETTSFILKKKISNISSLRLKFVPTNPSEVTDNFVATTVVEVNGTNKR